MNEIRNSAMQLSGDTSRLQGFSDAVFALSATLLVVSLGEVPSSYDELLASVSRFPAFALAFAALVSLWDNHRQLFARYPLKDGWTVALNGLLLFIVLLYVYPLKLLSEVITGALFGVDPLVSHGMGPAEIRGLYLIFGAAVVLVTLLLGAMHLRAWALREALGLNALARFELRQEVFVYGGITALGLVSLGTAALELGIGWGLPIWVFLLSPVVVIVERVATSELRRSLATGGSKSGG